MQKISGALLKREAQSSGLFWSPWNPETDDCRESRLADCLY